MLTTQSRRKFVLQASAVVAAPFISTSVTRALAASSRKLGFAVCGIGFLAGDYILPAFQSAQHCRLTGLITDNPAKTQQWQAKYGIPAKSVYSYDTMDQMASNKDIDVVYIVTPNSLHLEHATKSARAGKHVFCEKPLEITIERCQQIIEALKAAKRQLGVAYRCQVEPNNVECIRLAREKVFGNLKIIETSFTKMSTPGEWRLKRALAGGGALMDLGIYGVQAARFISGEEPILVTAVETGTMTNPAKYTEVEETITWQMKFPSGVVASCNTSFEATNISRYRAIADNGWFELDPAANFTGLQGRRSDGKDIALPNVDQFANEMDEFASSILEGRQTKLSGEEGLRDVRLILAIYESAKTGNAVKV